MVARKGLVRSMVVDAVALLVVAPIAIVGGALIAPAMLYAVVHFAHFIDKLL